MHVAVLNASSVLTLAHPGPIGLQDLLVCSS